MLFSAMPPLEGVKMLCSMLTTFQVNRRARRPLKLKLYDISRAHLYGEAQRNIFVTLPEGDEQEGFCGRLLKSLYGTQDASAIWQEDYTKLLLEHGFVRGSANASTFYHADREIRVLVHVDDFLVLADDLGQQFVESLLRGRYDLRVVGSVGPGEEAQEMCVLNRTIRFVPSSGVLEYEAGPRHSELIVKELGLEKSKPVSTPSEKKSQDQVFEDMELAQASPDRQTFFRSLVMRASYLAQDRGDIAEAVKSLARRMSAPTEANFRDLKRLGRYLRGKPRAVTVFMPQKLCQELVVYCDSDFAGCLRTRRSTTGMIVMLGSHCVKASTHLQSTISLSSGESEYYAIVLASAVGLQLQQLMEYWGYTLGLRVRSGSSAAVGVCSRKGVRKTSPRTNPLLMGSRAFGPRRT